MGINTVTNSAAIKALVYSEIMREALEPELMAMNYVNVLTNFPDGESWQDVEIGSASVEDYAEGDDVSFKGLDIGTRTFTINKYKQSGHFVTAKFAQDSYLASQIAAAIPRKEANAIYAELEANIFQLQSKQTAGNSNMINGLAHRFVAGYNPGGTDIPGTITPADLEYASAALKKCGYTGPKIAIVPSWQQYKFATNPLLTASLSYNPKFEGIVRDGVSSGMSFAFSIAGFDVYTSEFLDVVGAETLDMTDPSTTSKACVNAGVAQVFINMPDRKPYRMAWRQMPKFEGQWNMNKQREEYLTIARYGIDLDEKENLISILCAVDATSTFS